jgi:hypothetical protein
MLKHAAWFAAVLAAVAVAGCDGGKQEGTAPTPGSTQAPPDAAGALPDAVRVAKAPAGTAVAVGTLKKSAKEGDEVVLRGIVGGAVDPFVGGRAVMTVADPTAIVHCAAMDMGKDGCKTPWDYCCTPREELLANTATVRVAGPDGKPLNAGLKGWKGIEPLKTVVVKGVVGPRPDPAVLVVDAKEIFVE